MTDVADYTKKRGEFQLGMFTVSQQTFPNQESDFKCPVQTPTGMAIIHELEKQRVLIGRLMDIAKKMKNSSLSREAKRAEVQAILAKTFAKFESTAHPLHPGMKINSIDRTQKSPFDTCH